MNIGIIYGGQSVEYKISIRSVVNVIRQIEALNYQPILLAINELGRAYLQDTDNVKLNSDIISEDNPVYFSPGEGIIANETKLKIDCIFPLIHGAYGEDGCLQGLLELCHSNYIGENVATSAICMDKYLTKVIVQQSKINVVPFLLAEKRNDFPSYEDCRRILGDRLVVKPNSSGSSFGVSFVKCEEDFHHALSLAINFSDKILIEKYIEGREVNCAIYGESAYIGNLGEIINVTSPIYSHDEKYVVKTNQLEVPACFSDEITKKIKNFAVQCFHALGCKSMARVDVFIDASGVLYLNEVNTIPAFNENSIYPRLLESTGIAQKDLLKYLIDQAID